MLFYLIYYAYIYTIIINRSLTCCHLSHHQILTKNLNYHEKS